ncbi:hypothetical protein SEVIR_9G333300v4 [Setaria viridis]|uniref:C2H2-type domain-containing protein n=1 Tax=Setaria viridis TaxID=4556 RepID=A0A4U6T0M5_SETVI|nr:zinc finger protein ZAT4-like [Setaria viridis]TKV95000.1 hypothetical protein SEVIR_9G333300v2 [Setaria viridis]
MDRHTCKLCFRRFHNGRALGGHMRSHVMAAAVTAAYSPPPPLPRPQSPPLSLASTSSTEMDDKPAQHKPVASCGLRDGAKKRSRIGAPEFSGGWAAGGDSSVVQDGESDTESPPRFAVSRRRSKRSRRRAQPPESTPDPEQPASSVSDATTEEDVAMSLVMLSRDSWTRSRSGPKHHRAQASSEAEQNNDDDADEAEHGHDVARPRGRHQCGACRKVFRSYQALGGHRASVKKGKGGCVPVPLPLPPPTPPTAPPSKARRVETSPVIHQCPFCFRVFESGQALGGHKRTHMPYAGAPAPSTPAKCGDSSGSIDLNVPAAVDDDFELSAVYDAEFGSSTRQ